MFSVAGCFLFPPSTDLDPDSRPLHSQVLTVSCIFLPLESYQTFAIAYEYMQLLILQFHKEKLSILLSNSSVEWVIFCFRDFIETPLKPNV